MLCGELEKVGSHGVEPVCSAQPVVDRDGGEQIEAGVRPVHHRLGDCTVEGDRRTGGRPPEESIELDDLRPVGVLRRRRLVVYGGDGRLQLVRAERLAGQQGVI